MNSRSFGSVRLGVKTQMVLPRLALSVGCDGCFLPPLLGFGCHSFHHFCFSNATLGGYDQALLRDDFPNVLNEPISANDRL